MKSKAALRIMAGQKAAEAVGEAPKPKATGGEAKEMSAADLFAALEK